MFVIIKKKDKRVFLFNFFYIYSFIFLTYRWLLIVILKRVFKLKMYSVWALCVGTQPCAPLLGHGVGALTDRPAEAGEDFKAH